MGSKNLTLTILLLFTLALYPNSPLSGQKDTFLSVEILKEKREKVLHMGVREGSTLTLSYFHSLYRTPQEEIYSVLTENLLLQEIHFGNLEAAGYYNPNPPGGIRLEGGLWKIKLSPPGHFSAIQMRIPFTAPLSLSIDGSPIWSPRENDRGLLLLVTISREGIKGNKRE
ncbi:MAG: DUF1850 domain-containing protein [Thermodesulfobacteriota bacterium]|nr:DUF1850 domain-containing protein [Thermodesulfobacteriota bacterium]